MAIALTHLENPENRLLLFCSQSAHQNAIFGELVQSIENWEGFVGQLHTHRLTLLFLHHLKGHETLVPSPVLGELQTLGEKILHWNLALLADLQEVTRLLTGSGVRVLSYKGPSIAYGAYNSLALRRFSDLDFLVSPREYRRAIDVLQSANYRTVDYRSILTPYLARYKAKIAYEIPLKSADGMTDLDLHWAVAAPFESFPLNFEQLWERREAVGAIAGAATFCREDLLVSLCFHGLKHSWTELEWLACLLGLIENGPDLDWKRIELSVRSSGCERILWVGLHLANDLASANGGAISPALPANLHKRIEKDFWTQRMVAQIWKLIFADPSTRADSSFVVWLRETFQPLIFGSLARSQRYSQKRFFVGSLRSTFIGLERSKLVLSLVKPLISRIPNQ